VTPLEAQLIEHEGLRLKPYLDSTSHLTVGVGRNLTDKGVTQFEAMVLLQDDIADVQADLTKALPWWKQLDPIRQRVIQDMCFNLGVYKLLQFNDFLALVKASLFEQAADDMLTTLWARQVGRRARRLSAMMRTGAEVPYDSVT
jgi:lysozyme